MKRHIKKIIIQSLQGKLGSCPFPVFLSHGLLDNPGPLFQDRFDRLSVEDFERQVFFLKKHFDIISLNTALDKAANGESLRGYCALTFDDGYACLAENAFPVLERLNAPATVFIISDLVDDKAVYWRDQIRYLLQQNLGDDFLSFYDLEPDGRSFYSWSKDVQSGSSHDIQKALNDYFEQKHLTLPTCDQTGAKTLYLTRQQIIEAPSVIEFGNHTASHPILPTLSLEDQLSEIKKCKSFVEETGRATLLFCLPFGKYNDQTLQAVRQAGYEKIIYHSGRGCNMDESLKQGKVDRYTLPAATDDLGWLLVKSLRFMKPASTLSGEARQARKK